MNNLAAQIDEIVREVVRRLSTTELRTPVASAGSNNLPQGNVTPTDAASTPAELFMPDSVVTLQSLEGRLIGIRTVRVGRRAVVTPAVFDLLRTRSISIVRDDSNRSATAPLLVVAEECSWTMEWHRGLTVGLANVQWFIENDLQQMVRRVTSHVIRQSGLAIAITTEPYVINCGANRTAGVRSAIACQATCLEQALKSLAINTLVLDPHRCDISTAVALARTFVQQPPKRPTYSWLQ